MVDSREVLTFTAMIVSFSVSNFRSFLEEESLSLIASNRFSGDHTNHTVDIPGTTEKVLRAGVLYGANGAGKSNLFKALRYVRALALNPREKSSGTGRDPFLFKADQEAVLSTFDLSFIVQDNLYRYGVKVDDNRIAEEWLIKVAGTKEKTIYERVTDAKGTVLIESDLLKSKGNKLSALLTVGGPQNQSFLATVRATLDKPDYGDELGGVIEWFERTLQLIRPIDTFQRLGSLLVEDKSFRTFADSFLRETSTGVDHLDVQKREITEDELQNILPTHIKEKALKDIKEAGSAIVKIGEGSEVLLERTDERHFYHITIQAAHAHHEGKAATLKLAEESDGTRRLLNLIPALHFLRTEEARVYIVDEIDRSMHPLLVWKIIEFFLNSCSGGQRQIFVTTHESNLLDLDLLRRDEIWFAEKNGQGATKLYSLADFKIRKDLEIRKHYMQGRFGAIPFLGNVDRLISAENGGK